MKSQFKILFTLVLFLASFACKKDKPAPIQVPIVKFNYADGVLETFFEITPTSAKARCVVTNYNGSVVTISGVCFSSTNPNPTLEDSNTTDGGSDINTFTSNMDGLSPNTTYYVRAYATNGGGTGYSETETFVTVPNGPFVYQGDTYTTIKIGTQYWMVENLKTTKFNDDTNIPTVPLNSNATWGALTGPAYCWYNDNPVLKAYYGALL